MTHRTVLRLAIAGAAALVLCLTAGSALGASHGRLAATHRGSSVTVAAPKPSDLYSQMTDDTGEAVSSQIFEAAYRSSNDESADDFTIPSGPAWNITSVTVVGQYFNCPNGDGTCGTAHREVVSFYTGPRFLPAKKLFTINVQHRMAGGVVQLPVTGVTLAPGHYWVSVRVHAGVTTVGQWGWEASSFQNFEEAAFRNPKNGLGTGCTRWSPVTGCVSLPGTDLMFSLQGTETSG